MRIDKELNAIGRILKILGEFRLKDRKRIASYVIDRIETTRDLVDGMADVEQHSKFKDSYPGMFRATNNPMEEDDENDAGGSTGLAFEIDEYAPEKETTSAS